MSDTPQIITYGRGDVVPQDYIKVNTTSHSKELWSRKFSPFLLGPIDVEPFPGDIKTSLIFENAWQYLKKYDNQTEDEWKLWSTNGFNNSSPQRYPMGRGAKPEYAYWRGEELGYIEARFKIYAPLYEFCIAKYASDSFDKLQSLVAGGNKIALFDFDGYYHHGKNMSLDDVIYNKKKKMGHSFVLLGLLTDNYFWKKEYDPEKEQNISVPRLR